MGNAIIHAAPPEEEMRMYIQRPVCCSSMSRDFSAEQAPPAGLDVEIALWRDFTQTLHELVLCYRNEMIPLTFIPFCFILSMFASGVLRGIGIVLPFIALPLSIATHLFIITQNQRVDAAIELLTRRVRFNCVTVEYRTQWTGPCLARRVARYLVFRRVQRVESSSFAGHEAVTHGIPIREARFVTMVEPPPSSLREDVMEPPSESFSALARASQGSSTGWDAGLPTGTVVTGVCVCGDVVAPSSVPGLSGEGGSSGVAEASNSRFAERSEDVLTSRPSPQTELTTVSAAPVDEDADLDVLTLRLHSADAVEDGPVQNGRT